MLYHVVFTPEAQEQLSNLYHYITNSTSSTIAQRYITQIIDYCESLQTFPYRGQERHDIRKGLRITHYQGNAVIAFDITDNTVSIIGIFYGGQNYAEILS